LYNQVTGKPGKIGARIGMAGLLIALLAAAAQLHAQDPRAWV